MKISFEWKEQSFKSFIETVNNLFTQRRKGEPVASRLDTAQEFKQMHGALTMFAKQS